MRLEETIQRELIGRKQTLVLAESCTGGAIAARLTAIPDASHYFLGSVVAYSNEWKKMFLGVKENTLAEKGAVSSEAVKEMVEGILRKTKASFSLAVSGIAGPKGGTAEKPVGTVYIGVGKQGGKIDVKKIHFSGDRSEVIQQTVEAALTILWQRILI